MERLQGFGFQLDEEEIHSPAPACTQFLSEHGLRPYLLGQPLMPVLVWTPTFLLHCLLSFSFLLSFPSLNPLTCDYTLCTTV